MDITALRERGSGAPITVSELNERIKGIIEAAKLMAGIYVSGEISNFVAHSSTGHLYFSLKDDGGQIRAVMFRSSAARLRFTPENGMKVIVSGTVSVYPVRGEYQIYVSAMQPDGVGALALAYEQLKEKLGREGLFDEEHKLPLPKMPMRVGVITSPTGAAVRDIINVMNRRFPLARIYVYGSLVQGDGAEENLIAAVDYFDRSHLCDVVIIGRGGGSIEDLWAFNSEKLARRIYAATVPIISAVGHERDYTICDFVADMRAPTPSAAAEIAVPDVRELRLSLDTAEERCAAALIRNTGRCRERLDALRTSKVFSDPALLFSGKREELASLSDTVARAFTSLITAKRNALALLAGKADAMSPLAILRRGYSVASVGGMAVSSVADIPVGGEFRLRMSDGEITAERK